MEEPLKKKKIPCVTNLHFGLLVVYCFLDAYTHLSMMVCQSVGPSVRRSVARFFLPRILSGNGIEALENFRYVPLTANNPSTT